MTEVFRGCGVAIATPFNEDGSVDYDATGTSSTGR